MMVPPAAAGLAVLFSEKSEFCAMAAPSAYVNSPGAAVCIGICTAVLGPPLRVTAIAALPVEGVFHGTWKLIWPGERYSKGAATPFTVTLTPFTLVGNALLRKPTLVLVVAELRLTPNTLASVPGESFTAPLATLMTPPLLTAGPGAGVSRRITEFCVSAM